MKFERVCHHCAHGGYQEDEDCSEVWWITCGHIKSNWYKHRIRLGYSKADRCEQFEQPPPELMAFLTLKGL